MMLSGKKSLSLQAQVINTDDPKIKVTSSARLLDLGPYFDATLVLLWFYFGSDLALV